MIPKDTNENAQGRFSFKIKESQFSETQVRHPILKQIINEVIGEHATDVSLGSSFGEAVPPGRKA